MSHMKVFIPPNNQRTPAGGVRAEIYYFDDTGNPTSKEKAENVVIRELDGDGNLLRETYGQVRGPARAF